MQQPTQAATHDLLAQALAAAISEIADLDESLPTGNYPVVPSVIAWILSKVDPDLILQLEQSGSQHQFMQLLVDYGNLRPFAMSLQDEYLVVEPLALVEYPAPPIRILYDSLLLALESPEAPVTPLFRQVFSSIGPEIEERLEQMDAIEWGEPDVIEHPKDHTAVAFDHRGEHAPIARTSRQLDGSPANHALQSVIDSLLSMDDGSHHEFWATVDADVAAGWVSEHRPELASGSATQEQSTQLHAAVARYVNRQRQIEQHWLRLGYRLRWLIERYADRDVAVGIMATTTMDSEVDASELYDMFCRRLAPRDRSIPANAFQCDSSSAAIDEIRYDPQSSTTYYPLSRSALPASLQDQVTERECIAVRLPEEWLTVPHVLTEDYGLGHFYSCEKGAHNSRENLTPNKAIWTTKSDLLSIVKKFRSEIPVVYVFEKTSILVRYRFNRFVDVATIEQTSARSVTSLTIEEGEWKYGAAPYTVALENGRQLKPSILGQMRVLHNLIDGVAPAIERTASAAL
ncbi:hypothetical protein [Paraburkholderia caribensis]|uniref:hypothetical protein n=1 Tax=Paraburkholderia caribensis TaxID=75105 RepID=UPI00078E0630|nr:hypothetical protein [Paraburkholderia caribensis]AMV48222.1 hypothetical protein ATN79_47010 [Paraburkholderia caribensis]